MPRPFVTSVVSLLSKDEIEEITMVYRIPTTFKAYSCGRDQATNGLVSKKNCFIVYVEQLRSGLRFPLGPFIVVVLKLFRVSIA